MKDNFYSSVIELREETNTKLHIYVEEETLIINFYEPEEESDEEQAVEEDGHV